MDRKSVVIIGGGLGGLFTGAILSKEGLDVTVLEKNSIIGGGLQSFTRFGEIFDTGMHIIGGMQKDGNIRRLCEYLGVWSATKVVDVDSDETDDVYFAEDGKTYRMAKGKAAFVQSLSNAFPDQKSNLESYVDAMDRITREVNLFYLKPSSSYMQVHSDDFLMSADAFIAKYISDEHLRSVVAYLNPLFGGRGNMTPAYVHSLISTLYLNGPSRFAGGSIRFANVLKDCIERNGGRVLAGDPVICVHSSDRLITGIDTASGMRFAADYYINAIHPCTFMSLMDNPGDFPKSYRTRLEEIPNSYSAFTLNIKFKERRFKYINHTVYYMTKYSAMWEFGDTDLWPNGFLYITPPELNQGEYARKMIVTAPMRWDNVKEWENTTVGRRGESYIKWKQLCTEKLLDCMDKMHPGFRDCIEDINTASPLTVRDFYGVKEGSMCGYSKDWKNLQLSQVPVATKISNLYLTGQNCNLHGFCGVALTAISTSEAILGQNYIVDRLNRFDDIRPYYASEFPEVMGRIASSHLIPVIAGYVLPGEDPENLRETLRGIMDADDFQHKIMFNVIRNIISLRGDTYECAGIEYLKKGTPYLYVSNHRDIMMDAALLLTSLQENGLETPEVTFGANLMKGDFVTDFGRCNKMFKVERPGGSAREFYKSSEHLSDYIRYTICNKLDSIWIAQRNGRTKDGIDRTDQGILRMFAMSGGNDLVDSLDALNMVPLSISYEWEPCDILKTVELCAGAEGPYVKKEDEDLNSILTGIRSRKGLVHLEICKPISREELEPYASLPANKFFRKVAEIIDGRICLAYRLSPNNYIAHDLLYGNDDFSTFYTPQQKSEFLSHMSELDSYAGRFDIENMRSIFLGIYANPIESKKIFSGK